MQMQSLSKAARDNKPELFELFNGLTDQDVIEAECLFANSSNEKVNVQIIEVYRDDVTGIKRITMRLDFLGIFIRNVIMEVHDDGTYGWKELM